MANEISDSYYRLFSISDHTTLCVAASCGSTLSGKTIDTMAHVNNVRYVCWALDAVSKNILQGNPLKEIIVNYDAEVLLGEEVQLYRIMQPTNEGLIVYIQGRVEDKPKFCVKMVF